jgi:hypothetical protein
VECCAAADEFPSNPTLVTPRCGWHIVNISIPMPLTVDWPYLPKGKSYPEGVRVFDLVGSGPL